MYNDGSEVVGVCLVRRHLLQRVVVEHTHMHVILWGGGRSGHAHKMADTSKKLTDPATTQLFRTTKRAVRTGTSVTSKDLTRVCDKRMSTQVTSPPPPPSPHLPPSLQPLTHTNLRFVVPDVDVAVVQAGQHPRLLRVHVHALDAVRTRGKLPLHAHKATRAAMYG